MAGSHLLLWPFQMSVESSIGEGQGWTAAARRALDIDRGGVALGERRQRGGGVAAVDPPQRLDKLPPPCQQRDGDVARVCGLDRKEHTLTER